MKTIKQIANEIGVSKQAVYKRFKGKLYAEVSPYVHTKDGTTYIEDTGEIIIKENFAKSSSISDIDTDVDTEHKQDTQADTVISTLISMLQKELDEKNKQLDVKDRQIEELTATIRLQAESINADRKNELAETIIDGGKLLEEPKPKKGGFWGRFRKK